MSTLHRKLSRYRRGNTVVLAGIVMPVFIGFAALSVDLSVVAVAQSQLQNAADAAALAGARQP